MDDPDTTYRAIALGLPFVLIGISRAAPHRFACTIMATIYTLFQLALMRTLVLFDAETLYFKVTEVVPAAFPLLLIAPAIALDLLRPASPRSPPTYM